MGNSDIDTCVSSDTGSTWAVSNIPYFSTIFGAMWTMVWRWLVHLRSNFFVFSMRWALTLFFQSLHKESWVQTDQNHAGQYPDSEGYISAHILAQHSEPSGDWIFLQLKEASKKGVGICQDALCAHAEHLHRQKYLRRYWGIIPQCLLHFQPHTMIR